MLEKYLCFWDFEYLKVLYLLDKQTRNCTKIKIISPCLKEFLFLFVVPKNRGNSKTKITDFN